MNGFWFRWAVCIGCLATPLLAVDARGRSDPQSDAPVLRKDLYLQQQSVWEEDLADSLDTVVDPAWLVDLELEPGPLHPVKTAAQRYAPILWLATDETVYPMLMHGFAFDGIDNDNNGLRDLEDVTELGMGLLKRDELALLVQRLSHFEFEYPVVNLDQTSITRLPASLFAQVRNRKRVLPRRADERLVDSIGEMGVGLSHLSTVHREPPLSDGGAATTVTSHLPVGRFSLPSAVELRSGPVDPALREALQDAGLQVEDAILTEGDEYWVLTPRDRASSFPFPLLLRGETSDGTVALYSAHGRRVRVSGSADDAGHHRLYELDGWRAWEGEVAGLQLQERPTELPFAAAIAIEHGGGFLPPTVSDNVRAMVSLADSTVHLSALSTIASASAQGPHFITSHHERERTLPLAGKLREGRPDSRLRLALQEQLDFVEPRLVRGDEYWLVYEKDDPARAALLVPRGERLDVFALDGDRHLLQTDLPIDGRLLFEEDLLERRLVSRRLRDLLGEKGVTLGEFAVLTARPERELGKGRDQSPFEQAPPARQGSNGDPIRILITDLDDVLRDTFPRADLQGNQVAGELLVQLKSGEVGYRKPRCIPQASPGDGVEVWWLEDTASPDVPPTWLVRRGDVVTVARRGQPYELDYQKEEKIVSVTHVSRMPRPRVVYRTGPHPIEYGGVERPFDRFEYWFYYPYDRGIGAHAHDSEHAFVFVDRIGEVRSVVGAGHTPASANNILFAAKKHTSDLVRPQLLPTHMPILVELGKHASAPDRSFDGTFDLGMDANAFYWEVWGSRDLSASVGSDKLQKIRSEYSFPRDFTTVMPECSWERAWTVISGEQNGNGAQRARENGGRDSRGTGEDGSGDLKRGSYGGKGGDRQAEDPLSTDVLQRRTEEILELAGLDPCAQPQQQDVKRYLSSMNPIDYEFLSRKRPPDPRSKFGPEREHYDLFPMSDMQTLIDLLARSDGDPGPIEEFLREHRECFWTGHDSPPDVSVSPAALGQMRRWSQEKDDKRDLWKNGDARNPNDVFKLWLFPRLATTTSFDFQGNRPVLSAGLQFGGFKPLRFSTIDLALGFDVRDSRWSRDLALRIHEVIGTFNFHYGRHLGWHGGLGLGFEGENHGLLHFGGAFSWDSKSIPGVGKLLPRFQAVGRFGMRGEVSRHDLSVGEWRPQLGLMIRIGLVGPRHPLTY